MKWEWTPFRKVVSLYALFAFLASWIDPALPILFKNYGYDAPIISLLIGAFYIPMVVVAPTLGALSDWLGRKPLILIGMGIYAIALGMQIATTHLFWLLTARLLAGLGWIMVSMISVAKIEDILKQNKTRGAGTGMALSIGQLGLVTAPIVGGVLADRYGLAFPFALAGIFLLVLFLFYFRLKKITASPPKMKNSIPNPIATFKEFIQHQPLCGLSILGMAHRSVAVLTTVFIPLYVLTEFQTGIFEIGLILFIIHLPLLLQFLAGIMADEIGSRRTMYTGTIITIAGLIGMGYSNQFSTFAIMAFVFGIGSAMWNTSALTFLSNVSQKLKKEGTFLGQYVAIVNIGILLSYFFAGSIVDSIGIKSLFLSYASIMGIAGIISFSLLPIQHPIGDAPRKIAYLLFKWKH